MYRQNKIKKIFSFIAIGFFASLSLTSIASTFSTTTDSSVSEVYEKYVDNSNHRSGCETGKSAISFSPTCEKPDTTSGGNEVSYSWTLLTTGSLELELGCPDSKNCPAKTIDPNSIDINKFWEDNIGGFSKEETVKSHCLGSLVDENGFTKAFDIGIVPKSGSIYRDYYVYKQIGDNKCEYIGFNLNKHKDTGCPSCRNPMFNQKDFDNLQTKFKATTKIIFRVPSPSLPNEIDSISTLSKEIDIKFKDDAWPFLYYK